MSAKLFLGTWDDKEYLVNLKPYFSGHTVYTYTNPVGTLAELGIYCEKRGITGVLCTSVDILQKLLVRQGLDSKKRPSINDYAGSLFKYEGLEIVFTNPLQQLFTVQHGTFIARRFISKITHPQNWREPSEFVWEIGTPSNLPGIYEKYKSAWLITFDIETFSDPVSIRCINFTAVFLDMDENLTTHSVVIPFTDLFNLQWVRKFASLPAPKGTQNGKYDLAYLLRYNIIIHNWVWDSAHLFHAWYSELPKDLGFINAFALRSVIYWKDLADTTDLHQYYKYNAIDGWATANSILSLVAEMPDWAERNYVLEFPVNFPCILYEMTGERRDLERLSAANAEMAGKIDAAKKSLGTMVGVPTFNANSPKQVKNLLAVLGCGDLDSSDETHLKKAILRHPLNQRVLTTILDIRGYVKLRSTYLAIGEDSKEFAGDRILSALNPHGTDTGRAACKSHHFWCGFNQQNIPIREGPIVRQTYLADPDFFYGECDLSKAESWDTAYIAGSEKMIAAVNSPHDFHAVNASMFFGIPYDKIFDDATGKTLDKKLRDLSKRTNHGATYNMGEQVLIDTMGEDKIAEARSLLGLPKIWTLHQVAGYLLECFHNSYPDIKQVFYPFVISEVMTNKMWVSRAYHHSQYNERVHPGIAEYIDQGDWTRYTFKRPDKNKRDLNSLVSHPPQSLNARTLNEAYLQVFTQIALPQAGNFKLGPQIHDSIKFQFRAGHEHLAKEVQRCMQIPVSIRSIDGVIRKFTVPADLKLGTGSAKYWSETE